MGQFKFLVYSNTLLFDLMMSIISGDGGGGGDISNVPQICLGTLRIAPM